MHTTRTSTPPPASVLPGRPDRLAPQGACRLRSPHRPRQHALLPRQAEVSPRPDLVGLPHGAGEGAEGALTLTLVDEVVPSRALTLSLDLLADSDDRDLPPPYAPTFTTLTCLSTRFHTPLRSNHRSNRSKARSLSCCCTPWPSCGTGRACRCSPSCTAAACTASPGAPRGSSRSSCGQRPSSRSPRSCCQEDG